MQKLAFEAAKVNLSFVVISFQNFVKINIAKSSIFMGRFLGKYWGFHGK